MLVKCNNELWEKVRRQSDRRLAELAVRAIYKEPFVVYIASLGKFYTPDTQEFFPSIFTYDDKLACVTIGEDHDEFMIVKLKATNSTDLYKAIEVPRSFSKLPIRELSIHICNILCILKSCLKK